jgi:SAM-dependent methyltransferase
LNGLAGIPDGGDAGLSQAVLLATLALAGALAFGVFFAWTGNRIVSFLGGAIWVLHPVWAPTILLASHGMLDVAPAAAVMAALLCRETAWRARTEGRDGVRWDRATLLCAALGFLAGPSGCALVPLYFLVDGVFHRAPPNTPRHDPGGAVILVAGGLFTLILAAFGPDLGTVSSLGDRAAALFRLPLVGSVATVFSVVLAVTGIALYVIGRRRLDSGAPQWIVLYAGLALCWFFATDVMSLFAAGTGGVGLGSAVLGLLLPALAWRGLTHLIPEPTAAAPRPPPLFEGATPRGSSSRPAPDARTAAQAMSLPEIRQAVDAAVEAAVGASVRAALAAQGAARPGRGPLPSPGDRYAREWDRYADAWEERQQKDAGRVLGEEWGDENLERNVFENYCLPYLAPGVTVLEIGQGGGRFTRLLAPKVGHVLCLDVSRSMIGRARSDLLSLDNVSYVLTDGRGLQCLRAGTVDFAFSYDVFVHLDQEDMFLYLEDLNRVLRPGGRAVLSFANLLDPLGLKQFKAEAARHRTGHRAAGRLNFLTPELVRGLVEAAGLGVGSLHLAANNRDLIAILERGPR